MKATIKDPRIRARAPHHKIKVNSWSVVVHDPDFGRCPMRELINVRMYTDPGHNRPQTGYLCMWIKRSNGEQKTELLASGIGRFKLCYSPGGFEYKVLAAPILKTLAEAIQDAGVMLETTPDDPVLTWEGALRAIVTALGHGGENALVLNG